MDISSLLEVEVKEGKASDLQNNGEIEAYKNIPDFSIRDIASVRFRKLHCTACDLHIGSAPAEAHNMHEHPVLHVLLCTSCKNFYGDGTFEQGDDATDMFCRWCANGGNLYCCSYCSNTFCYNCIKRNFDPMVRKKIERDEKWKCFVCNPADLYTARAACWALLQHVQTVTRILQSDRKMSPKEIEAKMNLDESQCCPHRNKRKRSETMSDSEDKDETYNLRRRKRRKFLSSKRKRRVIKLEITDIGTETTSQETTNNRRRSTERLGTSTSEDASHVDDSRNHDDAGNSPSNDETGKLLTDEFLLNARQRNRRLREESMSLEKFSINDDEIPPPLLQFDQTMIEGAESLTFGGVAHEPLANSGEQPRSGLVGISAVPMVNLMKRPIPPTGPLTRGGKTHRLVRGIGGTPVLVRKIAPANSRNSPTTSLQSLPMVSIPSRNHNIQTTSRLSVVQAQSKDSKNSAITIRPVHQRPRGIVQRSSTAATVQTAENTKSPSVIDLDSDSDDAVVLVAPSRERRNSHDNGNVNEENSRLTGLSTVTQPIRPDDGLMTILAATPRSDEEHETETTALNEADTIVKTFNQTIRGPTKSIDLVLDSLKSKLKKVMESAMLFSPEKELLVAKAKTRAVNRTIKRTVAELTSLNDNLVRAYHSYKRERIKENTKRTESIVLEPRQKTGKLISLDMECSRESEPEFGETISDDESNDENNGESGNENIQNLATTTREIRPFRRRVHRAVEARPATRNKSVQACEAEIRDCEKSIGYSLLLKADYDTKRERDVLRPVMVPDVNFGKYEIEFINYLQHIEDHGIETVETSETTTRRSSTDDFSINELVEADLTLLGKKNESVRGSKEGDGGMIDENVEILEEHVEIVTTKSAASEDSNSRECANNADDEIDGTRSTKLAEKMAKSSSAIAEKKGSDADETAVKEKNRDDDASRESGTNEKSLNVADDGTARMMEVEKASKPGKDVSGAIVSEETVIAVRALIEEDEGDENARKMDIVNSSSWKPVDSDDECTILD